MFLPSFPFFQHKNATNLGWASSFSYTAFFVFLCSTFLHLLTKLEVNKGVLQPVTKRAVTGADAISGESPGVSVGAGRVGGWAAAAAGGKREQRQRVYPWCIWCHVTSRRIPQSFNQVFLLISSQISLKILIRLCCWSCAVLCELCADLCIAWATCLRSSYHY